MWHQVKLSKPNPATLGFQNRDFLDLRKESDPDKVVNLFGPEIAFGGHLRDLRFLEPERLIGEPKRGVVTSPNFKNRGGSPKILLLPD